ncbi:fumarate reductase flavoprotein subunit [hydrocarbon metagenome]|uniref:Fumarate reductase flavoprotein subunit n=1 Tax=hydrocarbon metagenome TaxID=938273 RepID=A0A0W8E2V4_9ZZZZ
MQRVGKKLACLLVFIMLFTVIGCGGGGSESGDKSSDKPADVVTKDADVVVIGAGTSGMTAAIEAASEGAKVILLEKQGKVGGSSRFAEGVFGAESPLQKELGITISKKETLRKEMEFHNYRVSGPQWKALIDASGNNIQWLLDMGVKFAMVSSPGAGEKTWHVYDGFGDALFDEYLLPKAEELGVELMVNTPGKELIMEDGRVVGVKATTADNKELVINTKAAIIATGGFSDDPELVAELTTDDMTQVVNGGTPGHTGDGIKMARAVGAASNGWAIFSKIGLTLEKYSVHSHINSAAAMEPSLWVNKFGERYVNEDVIFHYTRAANAVGTQPTTYSVIDSNLLNKMVNEGCYNGFGAYVLPGTKLVDLPAELEKALERKDVNVFKADTLEELADKLGVDKDTFLATIDRYNEFCANGEDMDYSKESKYLNEVKTGPFYAFHIKVLNLNSMGGIRVNIKNEVLDEEYQPIKGLYAAGMDCDGYTGDTYGLTIPGSCQGIALFTGRNSAVHAVEYTKTI